MSRNLNYTGRHSIIQKETTKTLPTKGFGPVKKRDFKKYKKPFNLRDYPAGPYNIFREGVHQGGHTYLSLADNILY